MTGLRLCSVSLMVGVWACVPGTEHRPRPKTLVTNAIREFRDKADSAEVREIRGEASQAHAASLNSARETTVEVFVYKDPEVPTYFRRDKSGQLLGFKYSVLIMTINGRMELAAFTSTGDPTKRAIKRIRNKDGSTTKVAGKGVETGNGTYSVDFIERHRRSFMMDADMPYAVFFNGAGIAIHETTGFGLTPQQRRAIARRGSAENNYVNLGRRASMGCVRLNRAAAKKVYETVQAYGKENVTITIASNGISERFTQDVVQRALAQNFADEQDLANGARR